MCPGTHDMDNLRVLKTMVNVFEAKVDGIHQAIAAVLVRTSATECMHCAHSHAPQDNDDDLAMLALTKLWENPMLFNSLAEQDHDDAEVMH